MQARLLLQNDWHKVLRETEGEVWVSCKIPGNPTVYGTLKCQGISHDGVPEITVSEGFEVLEVSKVTCLDISCGGGLGVSTSTDGSMRIWDSNNGDRRRELAGHVYDVNCCRFFPSGMIVLSGGMDAQVKVWSCEDGSCPVTFKGHKAGILDTAIVDRGRNVVSCSRDGTARLWDCGKGVCLGVVADSASPINGCCVEVADNSTNLGEPVESPSDREVGTCNKLLILAREDKKLQGIGLQSRAPVFEFEAPDALNCCCFLSSVYLLAGAHNGAIYQLDLRCLSTPVQVFHRSGAPIYSMLKVTDGFIASQGDGGCFIIQQDLDHVIELTGPDAEPIYKVAVWEKNVFTCCRDGLVRKYRLSDL